MGLHSTEMAHPMHMIYPLVICYIAIENGPVEIVDLPIKNCDFPVRYVSVPEIPKKGP